MSLFGRFGKKPQPPRPQEAPQQLASSPSFSMSCGSTAPCTAAGRRRRFHDEVTIRIHTSALACRSSRADEELGKAAPFCCAVSAGPKARHPSPFRSMPVAMRPDRNTDHEEKRDPHRTRYKATAGEWSLTSMPD
jgi:hypothetical protein